MSTLLEKGIKAIREASAEEQDLAGQLLLQLATRVEDVYQLTPAEHQELDQAEAEIGRGEIASDQDVAAFKKRHGV